MSELETELRNAIAGGKLKGFTLFPSAKGWQGNVRWNSSLGWTVEIDADPVQALLRALRSSTRYDPKAVAAPVAEKPAPATSSIFD